jgi:hypothetical protein
MTGLGASTRQRRPSTPSPSAARAGHSACRRWLPQLSDCARRRAVTNIVEIPRWIALNGMSCSLSAMTHVTDLRDDAATGTLRRVFRRLRWTCRMNLGRGFLSSGGGLPPMARSAMSDYHLATAMPAVRASDVTPRALCERAAAFGRTNHVPGPRARDSRFPWTDSRCRLDVMLRGRFMGVAETPVV